MAKIIDTIRALLAKAASTEFEAEAEIFLAKAYELMEKHQLCAEDLEHDDPVGHEEAYPRADRGGVDWDFTLLFGVSAYFGCKAIMLEPNFRGGKYRMGLVGRESARITATEMHKYLVKEVRRLGREKEGTREFRLFKEMGDGRMYWTGEYLNADQISRRIGNALNDRLRLLAAQNERKVNSTTVSGKNALITLDRVTLFYEQRYPEIVSIKGPGTMTTGNARAVAEGIGLNLQTRGGEGGTKLLG